MNETANDETAADEPSSGTTPAGSKSPGDGGAGPPFEPPLSIPPAEGTEAELSGEPPPQDDEIGFAEVVERPEPEPPAPTAVELLEQELAQATEQVRRGKEQLLRVAADFENFRKRSSKELEQTRVRTRQQAVKDLLPVFDNLERATAHIDATTDPTSIAEGIQLVNKQFLDTLGKLGIERVEAVGKPFDPGFHDSIQHAESAEHPAGFVMTELQPGYRMGNDLLRPALVIVSKGPPAPAVVEVEGEGEGQPAQGAADEEAPESNGSSPPGDEQPDPIGG